MNKHYTITIELSAENDDDAFRQLEAAVDGSSDFHMLGHRVDCLYIEEYDEGESLGDELTPDQKIIFDEEMEKYKQKLN